MVETAFVILNWNGCNYLKQFLPHLIQTSDTGIEIIIIDNASTDDSLVFLQKNYPQIKRIVLDKNYGFAGGYNRGLEQIKAKYYILLNSDVEVTPNWWQPLINRLKSDDNIVAVQPKVRSYHDRNMFEYAGACGGFIDKFGYPFCRGRILKTLEVDAGQYDNAQEIFWATGAALAIKADKFNEVGGFDDDFFAHMEEIDLCWRLQNKGYKIFCEPQSHIFHVGGGTLPNNSPFKLYLNFRNNLFMLYKNLPRKSLFIIVFTRLLLDGVAGCQFLLSGQFKNLVSILKAHKDFYLNIGVLKKKRKRIVPQSNKLIYKNSILWDYFIKKKRFFKEL